MDMIHKKKILKEYFEAILDGSKTFEIRREDDCLYEVGDFIELWEINRVSKTGRFQPVRITYKLSHEDFPEGIKDEYVVLGIRKVMTNEQIKDRESQWI